MRLLTTYLGSVIVLLFSAALVAATPVWLDTKTAITALQQQKLTSEQLVNYYLQQIAAHNKEGYQLAAITDINSQALQVAKLRDKQRAEGKVLSPLHGLPVVIKANIATAGDMPTTAGALALKGHLTERDAELVKQLKDAGAIILAKTNLSEWANFRGENSSSGWSALGGQTRNPHLLSHSPCGSSSGSAVATAADLTLLAVGTETDGSILCPAAMNGVVGIKPTRGAVSTEGIIPIASAQDIAGPMARTVFGAAILLDAMLTDKARTKFSQPLANAAQQVPTIKKVLLVRAFDNLDPAIAAMSERLMAAFNAQKVQVITTDKWELPEELSLAELTVLLYEYKRDLEHWLDEYQVREAVDTLAEIVAFNSQHGKEALAFFGQEYLQQAAAIDLEKDKAAYLQALSDSRRMAMAALDHYLVTQQVDVIILPSYSKAWPIDHINGDGAHFGTSTAAAVAGYPSITIPGGLSGGVLPLGISLVGLPWSEPMLLSLAGALEKTLDAYRRPGFIVRLPQPQTDSEALTTLTAK